MEILLPLEKMSTLDKLTAMEQLWEDLCRTPDAIPSPSWHGDVLSAREKRVKEAKTKFTAFDKSKDRIRTSIK